MKSCNATVCLMFQWEINTGIRHRCFGSNTLLLRSQTCTQLLLGKLHCRIKWIINEEYLPCILQPCKITEGKHQHYILLFIFKHFFWRIVQLHTPYRKQLTIYKATKQLCKTINPTPNKCESGKDKFTYCCVRESRIDRGGRSYQLILCCKHQVSFL